MQFAAKCMVFCGRMQGRFAAKQGVILPQNAEKKACISVSEKHFFEVQSKKTKLFDTSY
jgi:hypothetical protein